jgi:pimeloyl-ACP methyl ester carboxylesterase
VALLGDEYRIVSVDLPGHGLTGRVPDDDDSMAAFVATVAAVADHVGIDRFALGGNSMGGGVTWQFALAHPERVSAMILVDAVGAQVVARGRAAARVGIALGVARVEPGLVPQRRGPARSEDAGRAGAAGFFP